MTIEQRNAFYKGILAARKGMHLAEAPSSYNLECMTMWIAGHNQESERLAQAKQESALLASIMS